MRLGTGGTRHGDFSSLVVAVSVLVYVIVSNERSNIVHSKHQLHVVRKDKMFMHQIMSWPARILPMHACASLNCAMKLTCVALLCEYC
jgi:hypothetical protein